MVKIIKNYLYTFGYQIFAIIVPLITAPYITRELGAIKFGTSSFVTAVMQYFVLIATLGITTYGQRSIAYIENNDVKKRTLIFCEIELLSIILALFTTIIFITFIIFFGGSLAFEYLVSYFSILACCFDISWFFMGLENFKVVVFKNLIIKLITIILVFLIVRGKYSLPIYLTILSTSTLIGNLTLWPHLKNEIQLKLIDNLNIHPLRHLKYAVNLFLPQIAATVYIVLSKIILGVICNRTETGYFDNSDKIVKMLLTAVTSVATVVMPKVAEAFSKHQKEKINKYLSKSIHFVMLCATPLMFGIMAISNNFSVWFFGVQYSKVGLVLFIEAIAMIPIGWSVIITQQYLVPIKKVHIYTRAVFLGALVNVAFGWILDMYFAAIGTAIITVITEFVVTFIELYMIRSTISLKELFHDSWKFLISGFLMFIILFILNKIIEFNIFSLMFMILIGAIIYFIVLVILNPDILSDAKLILFKVLRRE